MAKESSRFFYLESLAASNVTAVSTFIYIVSARQVQTISVRGIKDILSNAENCLLKRPNGIWQWIPLIQDCLRQISIVDPYMHKIQYKQDSRGFPLLNSSTLSKSCLPLLSVFERPLLNLQHLFAPGSNQKLECISLRSCSGVSNCQSNSYLYIYFFYSPPYS